MRAAVLPLLVVVLAATPVRAEPTETPAASTSSSAAPLTLAEALTLAMKQTEVPRVAAARIDRARAARREARSLIFPSLTLSGTYKRAPEVAFSSGGAEQRIIQRANGLDGAAVLESRLFDANVFTGIERVDKSADAAELDARELVRVYAFDVAESFFAVLGAAQVVGAAEQRLRIATQSLEDAKGRLSAGLVEQSVVTRAELEESRSKVALTQSRGGHEQATLSLAYLVGVPIDRPLAEPPELPEPPGSVDALADAAPNARADVQAAKLRVEAAEIAEREPWLRILPTLGLRAQSTATNAGGFIGTTNWNIAATLTWVLFDGGLRYAQAAARVAETAEASATTDALVRRVARDVRLARARLAAASEALKESEVQTTLARRNADEVRARFVRGFASALEQADAASSAFIAAADLAQARFSVRTAQLALLEALGRWPQDVPLSGALP